MVNSKYGELIKTGKGPILSSTLTACNLNSAELEFMYINFRDAVEKECGVLFYEFENRIFYPLVMEFRLIDNNILFLTNELGINNFSDLCAVMASSFERVESRDVDFFAVIYKLTSLPKFSTELEGFTFSEKDKILRISE